LVGLNFNPKPKPFLSIFHACNRARGEERKFYTLVGTTEVNSLGEKRLTSRLKDGYFWAAVLIILATIYFSVATYLRWFDLGFMVGQYRFNHWLGWTGTVFVAIFTPLYYVSKRRYPKRGKALLGIHVIGNLIAFLLISVHFAHQVGRSPQYYPDLGTGVVLYLVMLVMAFTGIFQRFQLAQSQGRRWRFLHVSAAISFYLVIFVHVLHGIELI